MVRRSDSSIGRWHATTHLSWMRIGLACAVLLCLAGCHIPGLCCPDPGPALPDTYNGVTTPDSSADIGIIEFFDDPILTRLIVNGLVQNLDLKIRNQEIWIASNQVQASRGA